MNNNYFISIITNNESVGNNLLDFINNKYDLKIKIFNSIKDLEESCLISLYLIITDLDINLFYNFLDTKIIKFNKIIDNNFIKKLDLEIRQIRQIRKVFTSLIKEEVYYLEFNLKEIKTENIDDLVSHILNKIFFKFKHDFKFSIKIILKEIILNSIYHGNLNIDSSIKEEINGFEKFDKIIKERENNTRYSIKKIYLEIRFNINKVILSVKDEGKGFHYNNIKISNNKNYGRGIKLIMANSNKVIWNDKGNKITIEKMING